MKKEQKIYLRGSKDRPDDVRKILEQHGGKKGATTNFTFSDYFYYIKHDGTIDRTPEGSELYKMITEYYREVKLPNSSEEWKAGDILVDDNDSCVFYVFDRLSEKGNIIIYLKIIKNPIGDNIPSIEEIRQLMPYTSCHKADDKELKTFYTILSERNLTWDAYNKELVHGNYTYFYPKNGHYYFRRNTLRCKDRTTGEWYDAALYCDKNGQYVREIHDFDNKFKKL